MCPAMTQKTEYAQRQKQIDINSKQTNLFTMCGLTLIFSIFRYNFLLLFLSYTFVA